MKKFVPDRSDRFFPGSDPVPDKIDFPIQNESREGLVLCSKSCICWHVEDVKGWGMSQLFERFSRYIRKISN